MKNRLIPCVLACLMIFLVGCNGNTAKEAAQEITKTETSFPAGNTETDSQEETAEEPESTTVQEETPITAEESQSTAERQTVATVQTKPAEEKTADTPATEKPKAEPPKQTTTQAEPEKQTEQPKEQTTAEQKPVEKPTEKPAEPKPTEPHKQTFDVSPYVSYAKEYAVSIGLSLDITATECWDNPISANPNRIRYVVPANQTAPINWKEVTTRNFTNILKKFSVTVTKSDREEGTPQGDATLAGAVYGIYKGETLVDKYVTDKNGQFTTKEYVCDNDWTIREITPSEGYLLDTTVHKVGAEPQLYTVEHNQTANDVTEQVMKGNIAIIKHTDDGETQIETPENGATFEIYLKSSGSFDAAEEDERDVIVCDENGFGQTKDMPYGVYTVHQTSGWEGRELMKNFDVFIAQDGQTYRYLINNANFESYIKVVKVDAESGKNIPYAGAGFKIFDPDGNQVTMTFTYPTPTTIDTFYTDANGQLVTPEKLEYGKGYSLVEVQAPYGYVLDSTPVYFDVAEEHSSDEGGITVIKVDKPNMAQKGTVSIEKTGEVFSGVNISGVENADVIYQPVYEVKGLAGAVYEISAAEDIITPDGTLRYAKGEVVDTVTTDENGLAKSKELYLGKYTVVEITAPEGMVINKEAHDVELTYAGQEVSVTETATSFVNDRQKVAVSLEKTIEKNDIFNIGNGDEMKNISFGLFAAEELVSASGTSIPADGLIEIISLSENGKAVIKTDLPFGSYYVKELATDEHYILTDAKYPFTFSYIRAYTVDDMG